MNCEKGDLAVIVKTYRPINQGLIGTIVKCIEPVVSWDGVHGWVVEPPIRFALGVADENLRPLRDDPGTDESLLWAPVPSKLKEKA